MSTFSNKASGGHCGLPDARRRWFWFVVGLLLVAVFAFVCLPLLLEVFGLEQAHNLIMEEGIEAGAFFYPHVEKCREAEVYVRSARSFAPSYNPTDPAK